MRLKPGVRPHGLSTEILLAIMVAQEVWYRQGAELVVTSLIDGRHSRGSLHYTGHAVDLRIHDLADPSQARSELAERLGEDYDVVLEQDHMHVEFQPKEPYR